MPNKIQLAAAGLAAFAVTSLDLRNSLTSGIQGVFKKAILFCINERDSVLPFFSLKRLPTLRMKLQPVFCCSSLGTLGTVSGREIAAKCHGTVPVYGMVFSLRILGL